MSYEFIVPGFNPEDLWLIMILSLRRKAGQVDAGRP